MKVTIVRAAAILAAGSAMGLASLAAGAATCPTYNGVTWTVTSAPAATCHDYGAGNVGDNAYTIGPVTSPPDDNTNPTGDDLQIPTGYAPLDQTDNGNGPFNGALTVNTGTGAFSITGISSTAGFIVVFKQAQSWAAFLLPVGVSSGTYSHTTSGAPYGLSHATVFGKDVQRVVPIPAAAWLLGSGLIGLLAVGRRRKTAAA